MSISVSSNATLSSVLNELQADAGKKPIDDNKQIRLPVKVTNDLTGEVIYKAEIGNNKLSKASIAKATGLEKLAQKAVAKHDAKVDNWDVFKGLARNQLSEQLRNIPGANVSASDVANLVDDVFRFLEISGDNANYKEHDVRFGAAKVLSSLVDRVAEQAKTKPQDFSARVTKLSLAQERQLQNPTYDSSEGLQHLGGDHIYDAVTVESGVSAAGGGSEDYSVVRHVPNVLYGAREEFSSQVQRNNQVAHNRAGITDEGPVYDQTVQANRSRSPSPVDNSAFYSPLGVRSAEQNSVHQDDDVFAPHTFVTNKSADETAPEPEGIYEAVVHESEQYAEFDFGKKAAARLRENEQLGAPPLPPRNY